MTAGDLLWMKGEETPMKRPRVTKLKLTPRPDDQEAIRRIIELGRRGYSFIFIGDKVRRSPDIVRSFWNDWRTADDEAEREDALRRRRWANIRWPAVDHLAEERLLNSTRRFTDDSLAERDFGSPWMPGPQIFGRILSRSALA